LPGWQVHRHEGYRAVAVDVTGFWRPTLKKCPSTHYHPEARRALPAVIFGIIGEVGEIGGQRLGCPLAFERVEQENPSEKQLWAHLLQWVKQHLAADQIAVMDAGVKLGDVQAKQIERYVLRLADNFTARRNQPAPYAGRGRHPAYGLRVRPLARQRKGKLIAGTAPDREESWLENGVLMQAKIWEDLVLPDELPHPEAKGFRVYAISDPAYAKPWLLATSLDLRAASVKAIYHDRWPVEQIPLAAKQMIGGQRQFVHAAESIQRLPELLLLAGSILSFLAATAPITPTGFWDRRPTRSPGRFRRLLFGKLFPQSYPLPARVREKRSKTAHLPKGIRAHRRQAAPAPAVPAP
jgi:hypothetical protein